MAIYLKAKAPASVVRYEWPVPVREGDRLATFAPSVSSGTAVIDSYEIDGSNGVLIVSGGTAGAITVIALSAVTSDGETFTDTIYLPVRSSETLLANTVYDVCAFALRKIAGIGESATSDELALAVEVLNDMLAEWRIDGLDVGVAKLLASGDDMAVRDEFIAPIKYNLAVRLAEEFERPLTQVLVTNAERGRHLVANALISFPALSFEGPCIARTPVSGINDL